MNQKMLVSAFVFDDPSLSFAVVEVVRVKRKYAIVRHKGELIEVPKSWLVPLSYWKGLSKEK
jgi:hypothetical protein